MLLRKFKGKDSKDFFHIMLGNLLMNKFLVSYSNVSIQNLKGSKWTGLERTMLSPLLDLPRF